MRRLRPLLSLLAIAAAVMAGCGGGSGSTSTDDATTLHILAGSELKDVEPMVDDIRAHTGVTLAFDYVGTLDGAEQIANGQAGGHQVAWFSSTKYLSLLPGGSAKVLASQKIALSPVVLGVKRSVARRLGWEGSAAVTWKDVADAAQTGKFSFGMTNPASSNSGFSALVGVAAAFSGTADALTSKDINVTQLKAFFSGQKLTAGSSGFLADSYAADQSKADGIINYESVLLGLNAGGKLSEQLDLVYPKDGIITADYPLVLLDQGRRDQYDKVTAYLRTPDVQRRLMTDTNRRPSTSDVALDQKFGSRVLIELPFPATLDVVDSLLQGYLDVFSRPAHTYYVLDLSGSMQGSRLDGLKQAFALLTDPQATGTSRFARFRNREQVTIITFSTDVIDVRDFSVGDTTHAADLESIHSYVSGLQADGSTAIFSAMDRAYSLAGAARQKDAGQFYSVVLMTDGENNSGESFEDYLAAIKRRGQVDIPAFPILFGEGSTDQLNQIASATGGKVFDSRQASLATTFKEIRGYQ